MIGMIFVETKDHVSFLFSLSFIASPFSLKYLNAVINEVLIYEPIIVTALTNLTECVSIIVSFFDG